MKLYFGNWVTMVTTVLLINRNQIEFWSRRSLFLFAYGLLICCFAATRDGLDKTVQYTIDGSSAPGALLKIITMEIARIMLKMKG